VAYYYLCVFTGVTLTDIVNGVIANAFFFIFIFLTVLSDLKNFCFVLLKLTSDCKKKIK